LIFKNRWGMEFNATVLLIGEGAAGCSTGIFLSRPLGSGGAGRYCLSGLPNAWLMSERSRG